MATELKVFIVVVTIAFLAVAVSGFLVFANFLNREKERARRFRARHSGPISEDRNIPK